MASYDKITAAVNSIYDNNINYMALQKQDSEMLYGDNLQITDADITNLNKENSSHNFKGVYEVQGLKLNFDNIQKLNNLYMTYINGAIEIKNDDIKKLNYNLIGKLPENNNEIAISKYTFLILKNYGYGGKLTNENSILNKDFSIQIIEPISEEKFAQETVEFKIVGVIDTKLDLEKYKDLEKIDYENMELKDFALQSEFMNVVGNSYHNLLFMNKGFFKNKFKTENYQKGNYIMALSPIGNRKDVQALVKAQYNDGESSFRIKNAATDAIYNFGSIIEVMADVFVKIGIVFAVLALLLLSNFIGTSISYKKREIGVLRAIGARSWDVFGIFFNESLLISLINYALSIVFSIIACNAINNAFRNQGFIVTLLNFGIRQALIMLAIGLVAAFLSTLFPVLRRARMKPVDAIKK